MTFWAVESSADVLTPGDVKFASEWVLAPELLGVGARRLGRRLCVPLGDLHSLQVNRIATANPAKAPTNRESCKQLQKRKNPQCYNKHNKKCRYIYIITGRFSKFILDPKAQNCASQNHWLGLVLTEHSRAQIGIQTDGHDFPRPLNFHLPATCCRTSTVPPLRPLPYCTTSKMLTAKLLQS